MACSHCLIYDGIVTVKILQPHRGIYIIVGYTAIPENNKSTRTVICRQPENGRKTCRELWWRTTEYGRMAIGQPEHDSRMTFR